MISSQEQTLHGHTKKAQSTQLQIGRCLFLIAVRDGLAESQSAIPRRNLWPHTRMTFDRVYFLDMSRAGVADATN